jgi:hypothetical protein
MVLIQDAVLAIVVGDWLYIEGGEEYINVGSQVIKTTCALCTITAVIFKLLFCG